MSDPLDPLGWSRFAALADVPADLAGIVGRVRRVDRGEIDVAVGDGGELRVISDSQRSQAVLAPATGDWVEVAEDPELGFVVVRVLPRVSRIARRDPAEKEVEQVLVANVDDVGVVTAVDRPPSIARLERFLVLAQDSGARPVVVLTKVDLGVDDAWRDVLAQLRDVDVLHTSAASGEGVDELHARIRPDRTLVFLGPSGAGKSTLVNALLRDEVQETAAVRSGDGKGRHTTTARELIVVPGGGVLIDTPGVRGVGLWDAEYAVSQVFSDITALAQDCRFNDCSHEVEPGCAVRASVEAGHLGALRVHRYLRLRAELDAQAARLEEQRRRPTGRRRR